MNVASRLFPSQPSVAMLSLVYQALVTTLCSYDALSVVASSHPLSVAPYHTSAVFLCCDIALQESNVMGNIFNCVIVARHVIPCFPPKSGYHSSVYIKNFCYLTLHTPPQTSWFGCVNALWPLEKGWMTFSNCEFPLCLRHQEYPDLLKMIFANVAVLWKQSKIFWIAMTLFLCIKVCQIEFYLMVHP